ncbi:MAG: DUF4432 family protein [Clostridia bacterium]|nr:DUF4432 family protein [Clostridia bacterium]
MFYNGFNDISVFEFCFDVGKARGLAAIFVHNGPMECVVVKDHALDVAHAFYGGVGVAFVGRNGLSKQKDIFLKSFEGGLLYTCGLDNVSNCVSDVYTHGTLHVTPAENVHYDVRDGNVYVYGDVATTGLFGDSLILHRELCITRNGIVVNDRIENARAIPASYCLLYHCNFGAPFLEKNGKVKIDHISRDGVTELARTNATIAGDITEPIPGAEEMVYYHTVKKGCAEYINNRIGLGVRLTYDSRKLPVLLEWKSMAEDDYALGLEPSTTRFDNFQKTPINGKATHTYGLNIQFNRI